MTELDFRSYHLYRTTFSIKGQAQVMQVLGNDIKLTTAKASSATSHRPSLRVYQTLPVKRARSEFDRTWKADRTSPRIDRRSTQERIAAHSGEERGEREAIKRIGRQHHNNRQYQLYQYLVDSKRCSRNQAISSQRPAVQESTETSRSHRAYFTSDCLSTQPYGARLNPEWHFTPCPIQPSDFPLTPTPITILTVTNMDSNSRTTRTISYSPISHQIPSIS